MTMTRFVLTLSILLAGCPKPIDQMANQQAIDAALNANRDGLKEAVKQAQSNATSSIRIVAWNIESGGSDTSTIMQQLKAIPHKPNILALSEVPRNDAKLLANYWAENAGVVGGTGGDDRLVIAFDPEYFELVRTIELLNFDNVELAPGNHRAPLIAHLREHGSNREFLLMNNHLARGKADLRTLQAQTLVRWARDQSLPIIAVGDYNMDYSFVQKSGNESFRAMLGDNIFQWIKPTTFVDTNWADSNKDGKRRLSRFNARFRVRSTAGNTVGHHMLGPRHGGRFPRR